jgi:hypothetical protein
MTQISCYSEPRRQNSVFPLHLGFDKFSLNGDEKEVNQSYINRKLTQIIGIVLAMAIALWILRGLGILTFIPGGVIWLLLLGAITLGIFSYFQRRWWRF